MNRYSSIHVHINQLYQYIVGGELQYWFLYTLVGNNDGRTSSYIEYFEVADARVAYCPVQNDHTTRFMRGPGYHAYRCSTRATW